MPRIDVFAGNMKPRELNAIGLAIFNAWQAFATGQRALGGRTLKAPTGTYARSLRIEPGGKQRIAVLSDTGIAPHASILETGHGVIDMLEYLSPGGRYPMYRNRFVAGSGEMRYAILPGGQRMTRRGSGLLR